MTPVDGSFEVPFSFNRNGVETKGVNIVGTCRGSGAGQRPVDGPTVAPVMVVSAHYDHLGVRDGAIYHGADDNASGVAVMLALARQCQRTPWTHDVVFVAFDAEEMGLQGARAFVAAPPMAKERIALNVNLDMVSRSATKEIYVAGTYHRPALKPLLEPVAARAPIKVLFGHDQPKGQAGGVDDWTTQSDHGRVSRGGHSVRVLWGRGSSGLPQADRHGRQDRRDVLRRRRANRARCRDGARSRHSTEIARTEARSNVSRAHVTEC